MDEKYDFSGWATRANVRCSDGRVIMPNAFAHNDGQEVPLVWNHQHNEPWNVLGHALLKNKPDGVYAYCSFNNTEEGEGAKELVRHGDIVSLSIFANQLKQQGNNVCHGIIREVSLVLAGANPEANIDRVMIHSDDFEESAEMYFGGTLELYHSEPESEKLVEKENESEKDEKTVGEIFESLTDEQKTVVYALVNSALEENKKDSEDSDEKKGESMKHNAFDDEDVIIEEENDKVLTHSEMMEIFNDGKRFGSLKESCLQHGIEDIEYLFPSDRNVTNTPGFIQRDMTWVQQVMGRVHHTPFSRIKSMFADITADEARAKGYVKGHKKTEEVFTLLKRTTTPTTIYKKQKLDRDDVVDITDFDVVAWLKGEMRMMLDEEIARAILIGDGRASHLDDKINETNIRPIWTDDVLYTIKQTVVLPKASTEDEVAKKFIRQCVKARKDYKGSGNPALYTTEDVLTDCLLLEDSTGRVIYDSVDKLKNALRVSDIITVPVMEGQKRTDDTDHATHYLMGIIANLVDYNVGADKGGAVNMFDDFDIDYNAQKYLIETRCSGALIKPKSAIAIERVNEEDLSPEAASVNAE